MSLTLRIPKGSKLTFEEMDGNFTHLESLAQDKLDINSFNTFTASYATGSFTGSFQGDGSGLTGIPGVTPIDTSSFATTGSNEFVGTQTVTQGSINVQGSGSYKEFITQMNSSTVESIRGRGTGLYNITHPGDGTIAFTISRITLNDLTGAITSNLSGANNGTYFDAQPETSGRGRGARLQLTVSGGTVTSVKIASASGNPDFEEYDQPANRQGVGYKVGDTLTLAAGTGGIGGTGNLVITLRPQDIDTYIGHSPNLTFDYSISSGNRNFSVPGFVRSSGLTFGQDAVVSGGGFSLIAGGQDVNMSGAYSIGIGFGLSSTHQATSVFGAWNVTGGDVQTVVGVASNPVEDTGAFVVGNGSDSNNKSNLMVAAGSTVQITGSLDISESTIILTAVSASLDFTDDAAAQAGGVQLGGLYRNGNDIKIRLV